MKRWRLIVEFGPPYPVRCDSGLRYWTRRGAEAGRRRMERYRDAFGGTWELSVERGR